MKKQVKWVLLSGALMMSVSKAAENQVDYSKCRDFLTSSQVAGYLPFDLADDGSIKPHEDVLSYEQDKDSGVEVITYELPDYAAGILPSGGGGFYSGPTSNSDAVSDRTNPYRVKMRKVQVRIERDDQGRLASIVTDNNFSARELSRIQERNTENYLASMNEQQRERFNQMNGDEEFRLPLHQRAGAEISIQVQNGHCVPVEHNERFLVEAKPDGESIERTLYNTELCHEIDDFLNEHPETAACFNPDVNKRMSDIFKDYYEPPNPVSSGGPVVGGFGMGAGLYGRSDLDSELMIHSLRGEGHEEALAQMDRTTGRSPVISSHVILQRCYNFGLGSFIDDPSIWEEVGVVPSAGAGESENSATSR